MSAEELMLLNCSAGEDSWESLGLQGDQPVHPKGNQSWIFIGIFQYFGYLKWRTDSLEKTIMLGKIEGRRRRGRQKMRWMDGWMDGWHHRLDRHEFELVPGIGDEQGSLACCSPWGHKESDTTERLNWTELIEIESILVFCLGLKVGICVNCK